MYLVNIKTLLTARLKQLKEQEQIDILLSRLECKSTVTDLLLYDRNFNRIKTNESNKLNFWNFIEILNLLERNINDINDHHINLINILNTDNKCIKLHNYLITLSKQQKISK